MGEAFGIAIVLVGSLFARGAMPLCMRAIGCAGDPGWTSEAGCALDVDCVLGVDCAPDVGCVWGVDCALGVCCVPGVCCALGAGVGMFAAFAASADIAVVACGCADGS